MSVLSEYKVLLKRFWKAYKYMDDKSVPLSERQQWLPEYKKTLTRLNELEIEEVDVKMTAFTNSTEKTITVTENIYYPNNEYKITPDISETLDITVNNLNKEKK